MANQSLKCYYNPNLSSESACILARCVLAQLLYKVNLDTVMDIFPMKEIVFLYSFDSNSHFKENTYDRIGVVPSL